MRGLSDLPRLRAVLVRPSVRVRRHRPCASVSVTRRPLSAAVQPVDDEADNDNDHTSGNENGTILNDNVSSGLCGGSGADRGHRVSMHPRRAEYNDYLLAVEMEKSAQAQPVTTKRNPRLPSLMDPSAYPPLSSGSSQPAVLSSQWPETLPPEPVSGPSRLADRTPPTAKGKEKEHASTPPSLDPTIQPTLQPRRNAVGVQLLSPSLHSQLFPGPPLPSPPPELLDLSRRHLKHHGLSPESAAVLPEISFDMPPLQGQDIRAHFQALGNATAEPYLSMAKQLADIDLPPLPEQWETSAPGWYRYDADGSVTPVDHVLEDIVSFDVETLHKISPYPVMATAASPKAWYSWLSPSIFDDPPTSDSPPEARARWDTRAPGHLPHDLIPLFDGKRPTIAIGHNVGYDRARVLEEYSLDRTPTRWLDTLSLHVATRGITSVQRSAWMLHRKRKQVNTSQAEDAMRVLREQAEQEGGEMLAQSLAEISEDAWVNGQLVSASDAAQKRWEDTTSINSLAEVASLHCGIEMDKSTRDRFSDDSISHASMLRPELHDLLSYCATDVRVTHDVFKVVLPLFLASCPHPATFAGVLAMGNAFLPVDKSWEKYLQDAEGKYQEMGEGVKKALRLLAEKLRKEGPKEGDPWSGQLDWSLKPARWEDSPEYDEILTKESVSGQEDTPKLSSATANEAIALTLTEQTPTTPATTTPLTSLPRWYAPIAANSQSLLDIRYQRDIIPLILRMSYKGYPVVQLAEHFWCFKVPQSAISDLIQAHGLPVELGPKDVHLESAAETSAFFRIPPPGENRRAKLVGGGHAVKKDVKDGLITSPYPDVLEKVLQADLSSVTDDLAACAAKMKEIGPDDDWGMQLDWRESSPAVSSNGDSVIASPRSSRSRLSGSASWPKWYWDLSAPASNKKVPFGELDLTVRKSVAPLLLRMQWNGFPLFLSRQHKWMYRVPKNQAKATPTELSEVDIEVVSTESVAPNTNAAVDPKKAVKFTPMKGDERFAADSQHLYFKLPHKDGEESNVGNPLTKSFLDALESGELASAVSGDGDSAAAKAASAATNMNAQCSYWIGARERIMDQMVVWRDEEHGMILPKVITMGTVTRRAVESTWLTASNAKKNRVGSELKAMVRAPEGYAIVGADVDSEELWISSVMGDSQFGLHGATAIGWMTLEGTKSAGTDLHSKTASILKISRDAAKVFNYSRIYGAGQPHAVQLLMQGDSSLTKPAAEALARSLYEATKGTKTRRAGKEPRPGRDQLWHGGSESYLFNTLESIALLDRPTTPALGCGVTRALRRDYLDDVQSYLPSRINWVVQSSGVDYLHLLIASMEYLTTRYSINARYLLSVHDEVRYLAREEDKYRAALALQIANAWTRALFCYNLGLDDVPQGVLFFSAVDIDHVLRKETDMSCVTPSHPNAIAPGESVDIFSLLEKTGGGDLGPPTGPDLEQPQSTLPPPVRIFSDIRSNEHRRFLQVQAESNRAAARDWLKSQGMGKDNGWSDIAVRTRTPASRSAARSARKTAGVGGKPVGPRSEELNDEGYETHVDIGAGIAWDEVDLGNLSWERNTPAKLRPSRTSGSRRVRAVPVNTGRG